MPYKDSLKKKLHDKEYWEKNKKVLLIQSKKYREENKEEISKNKKKYYIKNREEILKNRIKYREENIEKFKEKDKKYYKKNKRKIITRSVLYEKKRLKKDIQYKLTKSLRKRTYMAIKNNQRVGSAIKDLGCTISELKEHLEKQFKEGMSWINWSMNGWHIDHIIPLSSFDLTDRKQFLEACNYTNLQPLWSIDNIKKSNHI